MLSSLHIENIAVIRSLDVDFSGGLIALTGETGSGKSVIIDSIGLLLGAKADKEMVRHGETSATVSGVFSSVSDNTVSELEAVCISTDEGSVMIQRTVGKDGRSAGRINGRAVSLSVLKSVARGLISIHGQSDTGALQDPASHRELLDVYCVDPALITEYSSVYGKLCEIRAAIKDITEKERERERLKEILAYQIKDIDQYKLHPGEEEELIDKKLKIKNTEKITKNSEFSASVGSPSLSSRTA